MRNRVGRAGGGEEARHQLAAADDPAAQASQRISDQVIGMARYTGKQLALETLEQGEALRRAAMRNRTKVPLIAEGDSWFNFPGGSDGFTSASDVITSLEDNHGYEVTSVACHGDTIEDMAYSRTQFAEFRRKLQKMNDRGEIPRAVLLSGGGNDVVGDGFGQLLNHKSSPNPGLNESVVDETLYGRIWPAYETLIAAVLEISETVLGEHIPILLHGYAYAVPDGRGIFPEAGPWLQPAFEAKGYNWGEDGMMMRMIVEDLIDRLNTMQQEMIARRSDELLRHVDLRQAFPRDDDHRDWWHDELHPTREGFGKVASVFDGVLQSL